MLIVHVNIHENCCKDNLFCVLLQRKRLQKAFLDGKNMLKDPHKSFKLYYSISEVARMFDVNESLLRYWEKEFPMIRPKKAGGNIRQYRKEDIESIRLVYHLVKEKGLTLAGAKQRLKQHRDTTVRNAEIVERLKKVREELMAMRRELEQIV